MAKFHDFETETFRASFPYLATPNEYDGKQSYQVDAIFDPATANVFWNNLVAKAQAMLAQEFPGQEHLFQWPAMKDGNTNIAKTDPQQAVKKGYAGQYYMGFKNNEAQPIPVVQFDTALGGDVSIDSRKIYSGCYARAFIQIWLQDNQYGKRVNIKLLAVKFVNDGESLGGAVPINPTAAFAPGAAALPPGAQTAAATPMLTQHAPVVPQAGAVPGAGPGAPAQLGAVAPVPPNNPGAVVANVPGMVPAQTPGVPGVQPGTAPPVIAQPPAGPAVAPQPGVAPGAPGNPPSPFLQ